MSTSFGFYQQIGHFERNAIVERDFVIERGGCVIGELSSFTMADTGKQQNVNTLSCGLFRLNFFSERCVI